MVAIVIGIAVVVALLVAAVYAQRSAVEAVESHLQTAQNEMQAAVQRRDGQRNPPALGHRGDEAKLALQLDPKNQEAAQVLAQAQVELDKIDNVITPDPQPAVGFQIAGTAAPGQPGLVAVRARSHGQSGEPLALNTAGDKLEGDPEPILVPGVTVNSQTPGNLIDIASLGSSVNRQAGDLVIGHDKGLIEYNQSFGLQTVPFGKNSCQLRPSGCAPSTASCTRSIRTRSKS